MNKTKKRQGAQSAQISGLARKTVASLVAVLAIQAHAAAPLCPAYEFAELQTYTDKELDKLSDEMMDRRMRYAYTADVTDLDNCSKQAERILRILKTRMETGRQVK